MSSRRLVLATFALTLLSCAGARAFEISPFDKGAADKAIASGKPVVLHVYAPWCLQCNIQARILDQLKSDPAYRGISVFRVDFDGQKDAVKALNCPRSTVIGYRGGKEVARMSWGVSEEDVIKVLKAAL